MYYVYGGLYGTRTKFSRRDEWDSHDLSGLISRTQCLDGYTSKVFFFELLSYPRYDFRLIVAPVPTSRSLTSCMLSLDSMI